MRAALGLKDGASSREKRNLRGTGGWPGLRLCSRLQWRDRGRFARPSPLPLPAKMKDECMPGVGGSQFDWFGVPLGLQSVRREILPAVLTAKKRRQVRRSPRTSDFSNWACAFLLARGDLLANLQVCTAR